MTSIWRREGDTLVPADDDALAELHAHEDGKELMVTLKGARNIKQHRLFFSLVRIVAANDDTYNGNELAARKDMLLKAGHVNYWIDRDGHGHVEIKSISFASMTQAEFNPLFQVCVNIVCQWLDTQPREIIEEVNKMIADKRYEGYRR